MLWTPPESEEIAKLREPDIRVSGALIATPKSSNVTVPVGVTDEKKTLLLTVAVKVTDCPKIEGLGPAVRLRDTVVPSGSTMRTPRIPAP